MDQWVKFTYFILLVLLTEAENIAQKPNVMQNNPGIGVYEKLGSIIPLDIEFVNEDNSIVSLRSIIQRPTILSLVYFDCPNVCNPLLDGIANVMEKMTIVPGKDYQVVTLSFNSNDNPAKAHEEKVNLMKGHNKNKVANWIYLTGDSLNIYKLADAVGFKFKQSGKDFLHPAVITILSPRGKVTHYFYGIIFNPAELNAAIAEAARGEAKPSIDKVLLFCYTYSPKENKYVLSVTKVAGISALFVFVMVGISITLARRRKRFFINNDKV